MLLRIVVEAEAEDPQGAKESLAMALERYAPARVVEVAPVYRQTEMAAEPRSRCSEVSPEATDSTSSAPAGHLPLKGKASQGGRCADELKSGRMWASAPTDGVVGPFARADAALRAAMEANEEIRR